MPSGNAQGIATLMVTISLYARRKWLWILATLLILCVGLALVYYGVHSPSVPEIETKFGKAVNVGLGLGLLYAVKAGAGIVAVPLRETLIFWPFLILVVAAIPLVIYALTPLATARILAATKSVSMRR